MFFLDAQKWRVLSVWVGWVGFCLLFSIGNYRLAARRWSFAFGSQVLSRDSLTLWRFDDEVETAGGRRPAGGGWLVCFLSNEAHTDVGGNFFSFFLNMDVTLFGCK